jgi:hypothetical protein
VTWQRPTFAPLCLALLSASALGSCCPQPLRQTGAGIIVGDYVVAPGSVLDASTTEASVVSGPPARVLTITYDTPSGRARVQYEVSVED